MARGETSSTSQRGEKAGGKGSLAQVACGLRGGHTYLPSRKHDGYHTCMQCGHRRKSEDGQWFAEATEAPAEAVAGPTASAETAADSKVRPLAMMVCTVRGYHSFMPSRRLEGHETCIHCGFRRQSPAGVWFSTPVSKGEPPAPVDAKAAPPFDSPVIIPFEEPEATVSSPQKGVDPRVLRDFLRQIDGGSVSAEPKSGGAGGRRRAKTPKP